MRVQLPPMYVHRFIYLHIFFTVVRENVWSFPLHHHYYPIVVGQTPYFYPMKVISSSSFHSFLYFLPQFTLMHSFMLVYFSIWATNHGTRIVIRIEPSGQRNHDHKTHNLPTLQIQKCVFEDYFCRHIICEVEYLRPSRSHHHFYCQFPFHIMMMAEIVMIKIFQAVV